MFIEIHHQVSLILFYRRKSEKLNETEGNSVSNVGKYRKKLQAAITQIHRTKKTTQRNLESSDSEIHGKSFYPRSIVSSSQRSI